jgi:hypothetical protein
MDQNQNQDPGAERRQFPRIDVTTSVKFLMLLPTVEEGITKDISQGGMCLMTKKRMNSGDLLQLKFDLPGDQPEHIEVVGKACWVREKGDGFYLIGIKFLT